MAAKKDTKEQRSPEIEVIWKENVPEAVYFDRNGYSIVAKVEKGRNPTIPSSRFWFPSKEGESRTRESRRPVA